MKKIIALATALVFSLTLTVSFAKRDFKGAGTKSSPYLIESAEDLLLLSDRVYEGESFEDRYFLLTEDITLNDTDKFYSWEEDAPENVFKPIGAVHSCFKGSFDGNGKTLTGLYVSDTSKNYAGLFGYVKGGKIKNLTVEKAYVNGRSNVGVVAGIAVNSEIENVRAEGIVFAKDNSGGIAGSLSESKIVNAIADVEVTSLGMAGGIAGYAYISEINSAASRLEVSGILASGGIVGHMKDSKVKNAYSEGEITAKTYSGGIAGYMDEFSTAEYVYALGNVISEKAAGGIAALSYGDIKSAYFKGFVSGEYKGALVGINSPLSEEKDIDYGDIENAYYAEDRCENAVGYTAAEEDDHDILALKASKIDNSFIKSYIFNSFLSVENLTESPDDVWVFKGKNPALWIEYPEAYEKPENEENEKPSVKPETGLKTGEVISTDIRAYIDGSEIKAVNIAGKMAIALRDLREFGFDVNFDEVKRAVTVSYKGGEITSSYESEETDKEIGSYISDVLSTDIEAYLEGEKTESFNAEGYTHVYFRDLSLFGEVSFDEDKREAHLELK